MRRVGPYELGGSRSKVSALAVTRSGLLLVSCGEALQAARGPIDTEHALVAWDFETGEERWREAGWAEMTCLALSPDERLVAVGSTSGQLLLIDIGGPDVSRRELTSGVRNLGGGLEQTCAHRESVKDVAFSKDGTRLYSAGTDTEIAGELRVWSVADGRELRAPVSCAVPGTTLDVSPDGTTILVSTRVGRVELWSAEVDE